MLFNSFEFLLFLPIVFFLYWFVFRERRWQNGLVVIASYVFYGWWDWRFLLLIVFTSLCSFGSGRLMAHYEGQRQSQRFIAVANIVLNIGVLGVFKYYNFFMDNLDALFRVFGCQLDWVTMNIVLPVGISFYTFQALSYTIDVYQKKLPATHDIVEFFAYISFFPQLVAGPIERATHLLPQFQQPRSFNYAKAVDGLRQMLWGFVKKMIVADNCAVAANMIWDNYTEESGLVLMLGAVLFTFQIYCDFSGYSDIAIGCARLFGIHLKCNFKFPYFSSNIQEFWRRWHISLMTWFRDYLYIPLGGNRGTHMTTIRNTLIVFAISGLWHGANWTFVVWGLYHALLVSAYMMCVGEGRGAKKQGYGHSLAIFVQTLFTFALVVVGWVLFRAETIPQAYDYLCRMFFSGLSWEVASIPLGKQALLWSLLVMGVEWFQRDRHHALQLPERTGWQSIAGRWILYYVLIALLLFYHGEQNEFIYFQF